MIYLLDTHTLVFRFLNPKRLSKNHQSVFRDGGNSFLVPTLSLLEVQYLTEIGRIELEMGEFLSALKEEGSFEVIPFDEAVLAFALNLTSTRDPFDRVILAHALATSTKILTKDRWMHSTAPHLAIG